MFSSDFSLTLVPYQESLHQDKEGARVKERKELCALMMLFYDYFMVYGTNTIGDHDGVERFLLFISLFFVGGKFSICRLNRTYGQEGCAVVWASCFTKPDGFSWRIFRKKGQLLCCANIWKGHSGECHENETLIWYANNMSKPSPFDEKRTSHDYLNIQRFPNSSVLMCRIWKFEAERRGDKSGA